VGIIYKKPVIAIDLGGPKMTRKHYIEVAKILADVDVNQANRKELVDRFVTFFADDNARFSPSTFREFVADRVAEADRLADAAHLAKMVGRIDR
jgi:hypothetical protein